MIDLTTITILIYILAGYTLIGFILVYRKIKQLEGILLRIELKKDVENVIKYYEKGD